MRDKQQVGDVVKLKNGNKELMIYGLKQRCMRDSKVYDYLACFYPEGHIHPNLNVFLMKTIFWK